MIHELLIWMAQGTAVVAVLMFFLWLLHFPLRNAAIADVGWAIGLGLIALIYAFHAQGYWRRTMILLPMVLLWSLRLGFHLLFTRVAGHPETGRYLELRRKWGSHIGLKFLGYFEFQALLCGILSLPFLLALHDPSKGNETLENVGLGIWIVAFLAEIIADYRGSRRAHKFFEFLIWISFALLAFPTQYGYLGLIAPALILIPWLDKTN